MEQNIKKISFIFLWQQNDWGLFKRRNESLLWELSKRDSVESVLHIEPLTPRGFVGLIVKWWRAKDTNVRQIYRLHFKKAIALHPVLISNEGKIYIYSIFVFHSGNIVIFKKLSNFLIKLQGNIINKKFIRAKKNVVLFVYPHASYLLEAVNAIKHDILIADLVDDEIERAEDTVMKNKFIDNYKNILPKCKLIFSTSPIFNEIYKNYAKQEIEFLPNGVDNNEFSMNFPKTFFKNHNRKVVGYVGNFFKPETVDFDLLKHIISCYPEVDFFLIGAADREKLKDINKITDQYNNCYYLGERKFSEIPAYLSSFDVLISFKKADFSTRGNDSMKIYQYLASGKPIVTTPVHPADRFADLIYVTSNKFQFAKYLRQALEESDSAMKGKRIKVAFENSWAKRADVILDRVSKFLNYS